jgi:hypothetical protein
MCFFVADRKPLWLFEYLGYTPLSSPARFFRRLGPIKTKQVQGSDGVLPARTGEARFYDRLIDGLDLTSVAAADLAHGQAQLAPRIHFQSGSADQTGQSTDDVLPVKRSRPLAPGG